MALEERLRVFPGPLRFAVRKLYALADALTGGAAAVQIALIARWHRAQILHFANGFAPPEALLAGKLAGIPTIAHMRGFFNNAHHLARFPPALVIGDSRAVTASFVDACGTDIPSLTLYEAVDLGEFDAAAGTRNMRRESLELAPDDIAVALFGRIVPWKGQKEFVLAMISAMQDNPRLVGVLVGDVSDGGERYHDEVKRMIGDSGMKDRFRLTGYVEHVTPLYAAMDIVVHASVDPEPCGMVIMEGMAAGKPVVAADAGGPSELVRNGVDGYLVPPANPDAMADAIRRLATAPEARATMGAAARQRARELYDVPVATDRLRRIYAAVISGDLSRLPANDTDAL
jgi:glycosyltransferase involved in cell wall biosynthesis